MSAKVSWPVLSTAMDRRNRLTYTLTLSVRFLCSNPAFNTGWMAQPIRKGDRDGVSTLTTERRGREMAGSVYDRAPGHCCRKPVGVPCLRGGRSMDDPGRHGTVLGLGAS